MVDGRRNWRNNLKTDLESNKQPVVWFHCASLGEFEQGRPLITAIKSSYPKYKILLTFYSPSGYEIRKNYPDVDAVHYLPFDTPANAKFFIETVNPKLAFIIKYEYWHNLLSEAHSKAIPVLLCSAIFLQDQIFFKSYGHLFRKILTYFNHLFVQNKSSKSLLTQLSISNVTIAGDTRMDRVKDITENSKANAIVSLFVEDAELTMVVGSSWPQDITVLAPIINSETDIKFIIAPHEVNEHHLSQIDQLIKRPLVRYTQVKDPASFEVLVIDTVGLLSHLYQYGDYAYIGGGFGKGLHNILEAATFGLPLFFGNRNYTKFREARKLVELGGAQAVKNTVQIQKALNELKGNSDRYREVSELCHQFVMEQTGATEVIMDYTKRELLG